jgi:hypothetical protein
MLVFKDEASNTNSIVFCFTQPGLEPTTDCIQDQQANHYNTDASGNKYTTDEYIGCAINKDMHARGSLQVRLYDLS